MNIPIIPFLLACSNNEGTLHIQGDTDDLTTSESTPPNREVCDSFGFTFDALQNDPNKSIWVDFCATDEEGMPLEECVETVAKRNLNAERFAETTIYKNASLTDLLDCELSLTVLVEYQYDPETHSQRIVLWTVVGAQNIAGFEESTEEIDQITLDAFVVDVDRLPYDDDGKNSDYEFHQGPLAANTSVYDRSMMNELYYYAYDPDNNEIEIPDFLVLNAYGYLSNASSYSIYYTPIFADQYFNLVYDTILDFAPSSFDPLKAGVQHFIIS